MSTKEAVLAALMETEEAVSGESLARKLGVSRNSIWKAIEALRGDRWEIEAVTNRGYRLVQDRERVSEAGIRRWLTTEGFGRTMEVHEELDSTNNRAKALAMRGAAHGTLVCARAQSGGRGRFNRRFFSPGESGIYMSLVLRPTLPAERAVMLTTMTAVAVARAIERLAEVQVRIKWVNDLYVNGKKICGILCEAGMDFESGQLEYAVAGIGVNVSRMEFPDELKAIATSIGNECGQDVSRNRLIAEICANMESLYAELDKASFMAESRARSNVIGRRIVVLRGEERIPARAVDIDDQGALIVETAEGLQTLHSGEVSLKWEDQ